ncbi:MAG: family 78 glycoside hydrolase catalytic domain [Bacteroidaceae bacterium]|nr:family 78 glycoside hydrolase catalytic domain [Bacteroidaceae bacterium]
MKNYSIRLFKGLACAIFLLTTCSVSAFARRAKVPVVSVADLRVENLTDPLGIDALSPRFSWRIVSDERDVMQQSYHILVASSPEKLAEGKGDLWDSQVVQSDSSLWVAYKGKSLKSNQRAWWKVKVSTTVGETPWSQPAHWGMGLLIENHWRGRWIGLDKALPWESETQWSRLGARYVRHEFAIDKPVKQATLHICGLGLYEAFINGQRVGNQVMAPAPTDYRKTILYNTYDVTDLLSDSANAIGVALGNGRFYHMRQDFKPYKAPNFGYPKVRANLIIEYDGGARHVVATDDRTWKLMADGPIRTNNEYDGEEYDARKELGEWTCPGYDDSRWMPAQRVSVPDGTLRAQMMPAMKVLDRVKPLSITPLGNKLILDMGQNMVGWLRITNLKGHAEGDSIRLRFAERLQADGSLYIDNLRDARVTDVYVCNGREGENHSWAPTFVTHGFRYVEVTGMSDAAPDDFVGEVVSDEMPVTGSFECSDTLVNRIYRNAYWGILGNYKGMPIDCPQRNERQPWLGDRTRGALGESYIFGNERLYAKWMDDIRESQRSDGLIPDVAPAYWNYYTGDVTWPAALPFICDMLYTQYGNVQPILENYPAISKWTDFLWTESMRDNLITKDKYGDWCVPPEKLNLVHSQDPARKTDGVLIASAYYVKQLQLMAKFARLQGRAEEADKWSRREKLVTEAFNNRFLTVKRGTSPRPDHILYPDSIYYGNNTVTSNLLPLAFGMVPTEHEDAVFRHVLAKLLPAPNCIPAISCGVIGVQWLMTELSKRGRADVAFALASASHYPSWGYMVQNGATTIWELWNGDKADPSMNSGNHVMLLGDLVTWMYEHVGGIRPGEKEGCQAFKHIVLNPSFDIPDLSFAKVSYETPYGQVRSHWTKTVTEYAWDITVPCNTTATVCLPDGTQRQVGSGTHHFEGPLPKVHPAVVENQFLYETASFPECHSATIVELKNGDLLATYFGGTKERNPDVCIWTSRKPKGKSEWQAPQLVADGVFNERIRSAFSDEEIKSGVERKACWNPVLFETPKGELLLFYKIGANVADWTGWLIRSKNNGKSWSEPEALPEGFLGPIKNKPIVVDGKIICPSSTEVGGWKLHFEISDDWGKTWRMVGPIPADLALHTQDVAPDGLSGDSTKLKPLITIQPTILQLADGRLQALARTRNGFMATTYSDDRGETWSQVTLMKNLPQNNSGLDAVTMADGRHVLIYNNFFTIPSTPKGVRTPVDIAWSPDGRQWKHVICLEDSPVKQYSYPSIIQGRDGMLHCIYTWRRQRVKYVKIDPTKL